jgi:hypothetical protein
VDFRGEQATLLSRERLGAGLIPVPVPGPRQPGASMNGQARAHGQEEDQEMDTAVDESALVGMGMVPPNMPGIPGEALSAEHEIVQR